MHYPLHYQSNRQLQERATSLAAADVIAAATRFFTRGSGIYSAFVEKQGPTHVVLRGQGGEEIAIAARAIPGGSSVTGSTYLFDQQVARFLDSLPPAPPSAEPSLVTLESTPAESGGAPLGSPPAGVPAEGALPSSLPSGAPRAGSEVP